MIHAPEDVMCYAVQGTKPLCKNTNVTVRDIRAVFKHSLCLICVLAKKKRKEGIAQWRKYAKSIRSCVSARNNRIPKIGSHKLLRR